MISSLILVFPAIVKDLVHDALILEDGISHKLHQLRNFFWQKVVKDPLGTLWLTTSKEDVVLPDFEVSQESQAKRNERSKLPTTDHST